MPTCPLAAKAPTAGRELGGPRLADRAAGRQDQNVPRQFQPDPSGGARHFQWRELGAVRRAVPGLSATLTPTPLPQAGEGLDGAGSHLLPQAGEGGDIGRRRTPVFPPAMAPDEGSARNSLHQIRASSPSKTGSAET